MTKKENSKIPRIARKLGLKKETIYKNILAKKVSISDFDDAGLDRLKEEMEILLSLVPHVEKRLEYVEKTIKEELAKIKDKDQLKLFKETEQNGN
jgi:hypothetical protein